VKQLEKVRFKIHEFSNRSWDHKFARDHKRLLL